MTETRPPVPLHDLVHVAPVATVLLDVTGTVRDWNPAAERLLGWRAAEVLGCPLPLGSSDQRAAWLAPLLHGEPVAALEVAGRGREGQPVLLRLAGAPVRDAVGHLTGCVVFLTDPADGTRTGFSGDAEQIHRLAESVSDVIWVFDRHLQPVYISPSVTRLRGYTVEEAKAQSIEDRVTPASLAHLRSVLLVERALEESGRGDPTRTRTLELELSHKAGGTVWVEMTVGGLRDPDGRLTGFAGVSRDITARRQAAQQLHLQAAALEAAANAIVITDRDGVVEWVNPAFTALTGYSADEILGKTLRVLKSGQQDDAFYRRLWQTILSGAVWTGEVVNRRRDGSLYTESETITPVRGADGAITHFIAIKQDVTAQKAGEAALAQHREALVQREKLAAMGQLLAGVAHELNNPLAVVTGQASLLVQEAEGSPLARRGARIGRAAERCGRIVQHFLALARPHPVARESVALNQIVHEALELLADPLRVDTVEVTLDLAEPLPAIWADPHQLHQVLLNLLTNAHQAMGAMPPAHRRLTLVTRPQPGGAGVRLEVVDTGPGIPPALQRRLFEPFFTTKPPGEGTGLGLSLCDGIVRAHGGAIGVVSEPGQGARFWVEWPIGAAPARDATAPAVEPVALVAGKRILVVDDEAEVAALLAEILGREGHQVDRASTGMAALAQLDAHPYDLILCDLRMPELDGVGFSRELARRHPASLRRLVFLTGDVLSPDVATLVEQTGVPLLRKPFTLEEVRAIVARGPR